MLVGLVWFRESKCCSRKDIRLKHWKDDLSRLSQEVYEISSANMRYNSRAQRVRRARGRLRQSLGGGRGREVAP
jgi:hypothetical protein